MTLTQLKQNNKLYFAKGTKEFFGDLWYEVMKVKNRYYLVTCTKKWGLEKPIFTIKYIHHQSKITNSIGEVSQYEKIKEHITLWLNTL